MNLVTSSDAVLAYKHETAEGGAWGEVVLHRPARKNAITGPLGEGLAEAIQLLDADAQVQGILLRGAEGAFCSGLDLQAFNESPEPQWLPHFQTIWRVAHRALFECQTPIVGALQRYAINGGAALALACDLLVAGQTAFLQVGEVQIGMAAPYNMAWLNLRFSEAVMAETVLLGDRVSGPRLAELGLATHSVPDDQVLIFATQLCERLADFPGNAPLKIKKAMRARLVESADEWFDRHTAVSAVAQVKPSSMK